MAVGGCLTAISLDVTTLKAGLPSTSFILGWRMDSVDLSSSTALDVDSVDLSSSISTGCLPLTFHDAD